MTEEHEGDCPQVRHAFPIIDSVKESIELVVERFPQILISATPFLIVYLLLAFVFSFTVPANMGLGMNMSSSDELTISMSTSRTYESISDIDFGVSWVDVFLKNLFFLALLGLAYASFMYSVARNIMFGEAPRILRLDGKVMSVWLGLVILGIVFFVVSLFLGIFMTVIGAASGPLFLTVFGPMFTATIAVLFTWFFYGAVFARFSLIPVGMVAVEGLHFSPGWDAAEAQTFRLLGYFIICFGLVVVLDFLAGKVLGSVGMHLSPLAMVINVVLWVAGTSFYVVASAVAYRKLAASETGEAVSD